LLDGTLAAVYCLRIVPRKRNPARAQHPFMVWTDLVLATAEMLAASAHVIAHRSSRPASAADIYGMGSEKIEAALRSSQAMLQHIAAMQNARPADFWTSYAQMLSSGLAPVRARAVRNAKRYSRR
jgi:hypothetical protein